MKKAFLYFSFCILTLTFLDITLAAAADGQVSAVQTPQSPREGNPAVTANGKPADIPSANTGEKDSPAVNKMEEVITPTLPSPATPTLPSPIKGEEIWKGPSREDKRKESSPPAPVKQGLWNGLARVYGNSWLGKESKKDETAPTAPAIAEPLPSGSLETAAPQSNEKTATNGLAAESDEDGADGGIDDGATIIINDDTPDDAPADETVTAENADGLPDVPVVINPKVEAYVKYFQGRGRKYFAKWLERSSDYMPIMTDILVEEGVPEDLFYIALIESGLSPSAKSRAKAVGMWQFIKGTAKKYGLRVDWWIDERRDPEKSTRAAARYFKNLYDRFGSWYLAAAGYNAGEGRIMRAMKKSGTTDFWEIAIAPKRGPRRGLKRSQRWQLKKETRDYVPKYLAAMMMAKDPEKYGFTVPAQTSGIEFDRVTVAGVTDLKVIAEASGVSVEEVRKLNPELLHWFTPPNYPEYEVKLPVGSGGRFAENIQKIPPPKRVKFREHKIKRGESLSMIAKLYGTNIQPIMYLNNIKNLKRLRPGTMIVIPIRETEQKHGKNIADVDVIDVHGELHG